MVVIYSHTNAYYGGFLLNKIKDEKNSLRIKKNLSVTGWLLVAEGVFVTVLWVGNYFFKWF